MKKQNKVSLIKPSFLVKNRNFIAGIFIFLFGFSLYINTLNNDYAVDDLIATTDNTFVQKGISGIPEIFTHGYYYGNTKRNDLSYRPISLVSTAFEVQFFGNNPKTHHIFHTIYYAIMCLTVFLFLTQLFKNQHFLIPFLIALLYAAHPIHTEVGANIKSRDELFAMLFLSLSLFSILKFHFEKKIIFLIMTILTYFLALLSKENALTIVAAVPLMFYIFTDSNKKQILFYSGIFLLLAGIYFLIRFSVLDAMTTKGKIDAYQNALMAANNFWEYFATNFVIMGKYLYLLIFPYTLSWDYSFNEIPIVNFSNPKALIFLLLHLFLGAYVIFGTLKKHSAAFGVAFYFITLSVASNFVITIEATMGERFVFIPSLGFLIAIMSGIILIFKLDLTNLKHRNLLIIIFLPILILFSARTVARNFDWKNNLTLYSCDVKSAPNSARTHLTLGNEYRIALQKEKDELKMREFYLKAIYEFEKGLQMFPDNSNGFYTYGYLFYVVGEKDKALEKFQKALICDSTNSVVMIYTGIVYTEKKDFANGEKYFLKAIAADGKSPHPFNNLGYIYGQKREYLKAAEMYKKCFEVGKKYEALISCGKSYRNARKDELAIPIFEQAMQIKPADKEPVKHLFEIYKNLKNEEKMLFYQKKLQEN